MKQSAKDRRALQKLIELTGVNISTEQASAEVFNKTPKYVQHEHNIAYLLKPARFIHRNCKVCGDVFATNYHAVAYCGDACRIKALKAIGVTYNPNAKAPEERWGGEPPAVINKREIEAIDKVRPVVELTEEPPMSFGDLPSFSL